jgi:hypothetical protein
MALAAVATGCKGAIGPSDPNAPDGPVVQDCSEPQASAFRARRLTPDEYRNAVADIFGGRIQPSARYPQLYGKSLTGFSSEPALGTVGESAAQELMIAAEDVGEQLVAVLPQLLPCAAQSPNTACATTFIDTFIRRAYRRTLDTEERATLLAAHQAALAEGAPFAEALATAAIVALQSPQFVYHVEAAAPEARRRTGLELASRLSFFLWASVPDDALLAVAESGGLDTPQGLRAETERMLQDSKARRGLGRFFREWTLTQPLTAADKAGAGAAFDAAVAQSVMRGFDIMVEGSVRRGDTLQQLLTSRTFPVDTRLAQLMALPSVTSTTHVDTSTAGTPYMGLLTHPAVLASASHGLQPSYVFRGRLFAKRVLCSTLGDPPGNAMAEAEALPLPPNPTARDRSQAVRSVATCSGCHTVLDPPGLSLEVFDGLGRPRGTDELGRTFQVAGRWEVMQIDFRDHLELIQQVAADPRVTSCFALQLERALTAEEDQSRRDCDVQRLTQTASTGTLRDFVLQLPTLDAMQWKKDP